MVRGEGLAGGTRLDANESRGGALPPLGEEKATNPFLPASRR